METEKSNFSTADTKQLKKICCSEEEIIISLTTWSARINNLPVVLKSILEQTVKADKIIVNLAYNEYIPNDVLVFLESNGIEVFYTDDTKVYKKFIPTLKIIELKLNFLKIIELKLNIFF